MSITRNTDSRDTTPLRENVAVLFVFGIFAAHDQVKKVKAKAAEIQRDT